MRHLDKRLLNIVRYRNSKTTGEKLRNLVPLKNYNKVDNSARSLGPKLVYKGLLSDQLTSLSAALRHAIVYIKLSITHCILYYGKLSFPTSQILKQFSYRITY